MYGCRGTSCTSRNNIFGPSHVTPQRFASALPRARSSLSFSPPTAPFWDMGFSTSTTAIHYTTSTTTIRGDDPLRLLRLDDPSPLPPLRRTLRTQPRRPRAGRLRGFLHTHPPAIMGMPGPLSCSPPHRLTSVYRDISSAPVRDVPRVRGSLCLLNTPYLKTSSLAPS